MWQGLESREAQRLTLVWESQELIKLNFSIVSFLKDQASAPPDTFPLPTGNAVLRAMQGAIAGGPDGLH